MELIQTHTVESGGISGILFDSIPQDFTDLYLALTLRSNASARTDEARIKINTLTTNQRAKNFEGTGTTAVSTTKERIFGLASGGTSGSNVFGSSDLLFINYSSNLIKPIDVQAAAGSNASATLLTFSVQRCSDTSPITSLEINPTTGSLFTEFSTASLYGITKGSDGITTVS